MKHPDPQVRQDADDLVQLMTPILKAYLTDSASEAANLGVQTMGGHGFIKEWGMEQLVRDSRIAQLYEGTNGIQALDLTGRKLGAHFGRYLRSFFHPVAAFWKKTRRTQRWRNQWPTAEGCWHFAANHRDVGAKRHERPRRNRGSVK